MTSEKTCWLTSREAAAHLRCHVNTIAAWVRTRGLPVSRAGGRKLLFSREAIDAWVESAGTRR